MSTIKVKKKRITISNIYSYLQGWYRYRLYYSSGPLRFLMRKHIREQIDSRILSMNPECYNSGSCIECGCATTALQMCNKSCEGGCYPTLVNKKLWKMFTSGEVKAIYNKNNSWFINFVEDNKSSKNKLKFKKV